MRLSLILLISLVLISCSSTKKASYVPTDAETISAVKELMSGSTSKALINLSKTQQNGIESILPAEVKPIISTLRTLGFTKEISKIDNMLKASSGLVYAEGNSIMNDAIAGLRITNAASILNGDENAASTVLKNAMSSSIKTKYNQKIATALKAIPETKYWDVAIRTYNTFAKNKINGSLEDFITDTEVQAVFEGMSHEEREIRNNPNKLKSDSFTKVFEYYQSNNAKELKQ